MPRRRWNHSATARVIHQAGAPAYYYTIFPTSVFNNNPEHLQLFRSVPERACTPRVFSGENPRSRSASDAQESTMARIFASGRVAGAALAGFLAAGALLITFGIAIERG